MARLWIVALAAVVGCAQPASRRSLDLTPCAIDALAEEAQCGVLDVLEDAANGQSRRIALHVAVLPAQSAAPAPDPLFVFAGGPGQGARSYAALFARIFRAIRHERDLVFLDFRGTGDSAPLRCKHPRDDEGESMLWRVTANDVAACLSALDGDVRFYAHEAVLADVERVRSGLGYDRINIWGGSYGTRAALLYALDHPARVRTLTLDGAVPLAQRFPLSTAEDGQRALDLLLQRCAADDACQARFPDLANQIAVLFERVREPQPVVIRNPLTAHEWRGTVDWRVVGSAVRTFLYSPHHTTLIPYVLYRAAADDWAPFFAMLADASGSTVDTMALGMTLSVLCSEDVPRIDPQAIAATIGRSWMGRAEIEWWTAACQIWPRHQVPSFFTRQLDRLPMPALILSGDADPATPPRWGDEMRRHFTDARHLVVTAGHNTSFTGCVPALITTFIARGSSSALETRCLDAIARPTFTVGPQGPQR